MTCNLTFTRSGFFLMRVWRIGLILHIPLPYIFLHPLVDLSTSMCMACLNGFVDPLPTLSWQTQNLLAEVCELRLVAKDFLVLCFIVALNSRQVILVHSNSLFFAHSFEFDPIIVLISLSQLLFFDLAILFETFRKTVFVFVDAVEGPWWPRHIIFAGDVSLVFWVSDIPPVLMLFQRKAMQRRSFSTLPVRGCAFEFDTERSRVKTLFTHCSNLALVVSLPYRVSLSTILSHSFIFVVSYFVVAASGLDFIHDKFAIYIKC